VLADDTTHEVIDKLKRAGDVYSPKHGLSVRCKLIAIIYLQLADNIFLRIF